MLDRLKIRWMSRGPETQIWQGRGDDVIAIHAPDGRFLKLSEGARQVFGVEPELLVGRRLMDVIAPAHQDRLLEALGELSEAGPEGRTRFEARVRVGQTLGAAVEIALTRTKEGFTSVTRNIEHRLAQEALMREESQQILEMAERRNEQLANVSHEIRTPLNAVIGFADAIYGERFGPLENDKYRDYARVIHESGQHLLSLISDVLDLSKIEANEHEVETSPVAPAEVVALCADMMHLRASEAGLTITTDVDETVGTVLLDAKVFRQIILNLLSNAIKFTERGGVHVSLKPSGDELVLTVTDTGVGMSPDELAMVGERFKQARAEGVRGTRGSGIGLSLSKALARLHGGDLHLKSEAGEGTTAMLRLPLNRPEISDPGTHDPLSNVTPLPRSHRR